MRGGGQGAAVGARVRRVQREKRARVVGVITSTGGEMVGVLY